MRPHPRIHKAIKWGGLCFACAMGALTVLSSDHCWGWHWRDSGETRFVFVEEGRLGFKGSYWYVVTPDPAFPTGFVSRQRVTSTIRWWFHYERYITALYVNIPLWTLALASLAVSALAWRLETLASRRAKLGACPTCSYDRIGLAPSSPCPECGATAPQA